MRTRGAAVGALVGVAVLALAACGSSSSGGAAGSGTSTTQASSAAPTTTAAAGAASATVKTASNSKFGTILVDSAGRTLYTLTSGGKAVACSSTCLGAWPPLLLTGGATSATAAGGVTGLGTTSAAGGTQVTENGLPLYHFSGDTAAGDTNGDGISSFGGTWHVVKASGATATTAAGVVAPTTVPAPTTTSGYGY